MKTLADPTRRRVFERIAQGDAPGVGELCAAALALAALASGAAFAAEPAPAAKRSARPYGKRFA